MSIKIICLTPIKNEGWILDKFMQSANLWADKIIIADQSTTSVSKKTIMRYPKAIYVRNKSSQFNEPERQKLLIKEARKIKGNKILIALDADEFITLDNDSLKELEEIKRLKKGTVIKFDWANIKLKDNKYWYAPQKMPFGYVDDGSSHRGKKIHSPRIPTPKNANEYNSKYIIVMHYQYADWMRMESKHRWYQCWEMVNNPKRSPIDIYRQYHHMYSIGEKDLRLIPEKWFDGYNKNNIDLKIINEQEIYYWDKDVIKYFLKYGTDYFRKISVWDFDWNKLTVKFKVNDPRNTFDRLIQRYLNISQKYYPYFVIKIIDNFLRRIY